MQSFRPLFSLLLYICFSMPYQALRQHLQLQKTRRFIPARPQTEHKTMSFAVTEHIAAISPYFKFQTQPAHPPGLDVKGAVYLFRHGIIHVNGHDFHTGIVPFLNKLEHLKNGAKEFTRGKLAFLQNYSCRISEEDIGRVSEKGIRQCHKMGEVFSQRYADTLLARDSPRGLHIWTDSAARCQASAEAFGQGFEGSSGVRTGENLAANCFQKLGRVLHLAAARPLGSRSLASTSIFEAAKICVGTNNSKRSIKMLAKLPLMNSSSNILRP